MTTPDSGVDQLFRQATDHLDADVDRLVAGGLARGRARRRRHLAGTAVAAVASFGVLGVGAAVVPGLGGHTASDVPVTTGGGTPTPIPTPAPTSTPSSSATPATSQLSEPGEPTVSAADIPERLGDLAPGHQVSAPLTTPPYQLVDEDSEKIVHFRVDGMLTSIVITRASASLAYDCTDESAVDCRSLGDGTVVQVAAPTTADQVTMREVVAIGQTWMVSVLSYNAAEGKDVTPVQDEPALNADELAALATSDAWFG